MKTIYETTKTSVKEVLKGMIINPFYIIIKEGEKTTKHNLKINYETKLEELKIFYTFNKKFVKNMWYNNHTKILTIEIL